MFRISQRLRSEPLWLRFFNKQRGTDLQYNRIFKDLSDPSRVINALLQSSNSGYNDMNSSQLMKAASIYKYLQRYAQKRFRERTFLSEFIEKLRFKVEDQKSIQWTPKSLSDWCRFVQKNSKVHKEAFNKHTTPQILDTALSKLDDFDIITLSGITSRIARYPDYYHKMVDCLTKKLESSPNLDFASLSESQLFDFLLGAVLKRNSHQIPVTRDQSEFPQVLFANLVENLKLRIENGFQNHINYSIVAQCFRFVQGPKSSELKDFLGHTALKMLNNEQKYIDIGFDNTSPYQLMQFVVSFGNKHPLSREIFEQIGAKVFIAHVMRTSTFFLAMNGIARIQLFMNYLRVAAQNEIFQLVFLDMAVAHISEELEMKQRPIYLKYLSEILKNLAILNYANRFNTAMPHKETQWEHWQNLLKKSEESFVSSNAESTSVDDDESDSEVQIGEESYAIDYLWALCVFDFYSRPVLQTLITPSLLKKDQILSSETFKRLYQVHIWLQKEYSQEFTLDSKAMLALSRAREKFQVSPIVRGVTSELKEAIDKTLRENSTQFERDYKEYPYVLDFVQRGTQNYAVIVDEDSSYLAGSGGIVRPGFSKTMNRQLIHMGWVVKKYSLKSWLKSGHMRIFPNQ